MSPAANPSNDSEQPSSTSQPRRPTPLPKLQLFILLYLQVAEPVTAFVILPFINQLIFEYGMTNGDETKVGYYAGAVSSLFFLTEMICVYHWARLSDKIGRRPVLITGLCGLIISSVCFGISKTFIALMLSRALSGALNGNIAIHKSMMAEITDETNQAKAFSFMPLVFAGGSSIASFLGGSLSHPYERFPKAFGHTQFWKDYPYALPCFVAAAFCVSAVLLTYFFLEESLKSKHVTNAQSNLNGSDAGDATPTATTPLIPKKEPARPPLREVLTPRVKVAILNYGAYALLNVNFLLLQPLFMSTPIVYGGLGLDTLPIGIILGINGIVNGIVQVLFFAPLHNRFGTRNIYMVGIVSYSVIFIAWPIMNLLARRSGKVDGPVIVVLVVQLLASTLTGMGFSCTHIFITSAAPTRNTLGATTGLGQSLVSLIRAVGPVIMSSLFAASIQHNLLGGQLVYVVLVLTVVLALVMATRLPKIMKREGGQNED